MENNLLSKTEIRRKLGLFAFIATGGGLIFSTMFNEENIYKIEILIIYGCFFIISLAEYYRKMQRQTDKGAEVKLDKRSLYVITCSILAATLTWFINHEMGYGAVIANGLVGVMAVTFLPDDLAGLSFTASFIGMSSLKVLPSIWAAALGGLVVGTVLLLTAEIYKGIGGKGGTTAALSTMITRAILRIFG